LNLPRFFAELKRRNVYKVGVAYAVVAWLLIQIATQVFPFFDIPNWAVRLVVLLLAIGFPVALVLAWAFELTPSGIRTDTEPDVPRSTRRQGAWAVAAFGAAIGAAVLTFYWSRASTPKREAVERTGLVPGSAAPSIAPPPADGAREKSIAVLPFQNLSKDEENAFFADGVQDEILTTLAKVADLKVISRTSVMQYKNTERRNLPEIAQALKVAHVLEGSVQRSANRVRVTAQLIDARTDAHLWAERYDRELADVFAIQSEIAEKIAQQLQARLSPTEKAAIEAKPTQNVAAYDLYLRAKELSRNPAPGDQEIREGIRLLEDAVRRDPAFVPALCLLVRAHLGLYWRAFDETPERVELAKTALDAAARLNADAGEVHLARAYFHYWGKREYDAALAELALARRALPNDADVAFLTGSLQRRQGKWEDATRHFEAAATLDPQNNVFQLELASVYRQHRRFPDAAQVLDKALRLTPDNFPLARMRAALDATASADLRRLQEVERGNAIKSANPDEAAEFRMTLALGQRDYRAAQQALAAYRPRELTGAAGYVLPREWLEGLISLGLGDAERARASFLAARERAAGRVAARPDDGLALMVLAQIDARLGRKEEALREGERALELIVATGDELQRTSNMNRLASVCAQAGELERALDLLEQAAKQPNGPTYGSLKLNEEWDPLRSHPRFEKLVEALAPKDPPPPVR
jgi:TolB-like protein/Tfp pilus assembly protein PilF